MDKGTLIQDIGEFALLERLTAVLGSVAQGAGQGVIRGIGDDAAVLQPTPGTRLLATSDMLVEGVHFDLSYVSPEQLGWKALAVNISDIAAMGGNPRWALVSIGIRPDLEIGFVENIYAGIAELAKKYGIIVVGGDTCSSPGGLVLDVCILGEAYRAEVVYRSGAREGDIILVTGSLGASAAGLACLQKTVDNIDPKMKDPLLKAHLTPMPRVKEAAILVKSGIVGAVNDLSDGLASELHEIVLSSGCGAHIWAERIPIDRPTVYMAGQLGIDPLQWALYGGEDYELLLTISGGKGSPLKARKLARSLMKATGTPLHLIGRIFPASQGLKIVFPGDRIEPLHPKGYSHFCPNSPI